LPSPQCERRTGSTGIAAVSRALWHHAIQFPQEPKVNRIVFWLRRGRNLHRPRLIPKFFTLSPSHQIFKHMYRAINVDKKITNCTV
jgi:hypothetical protein